MGGGGGEGVVREQMCCGRDWGSYRFGAAVVYAEVRLTYYGKLNGKLLSECSHTGWIKEGGGSAQGGKGRGGGVKLGACTPFNWRVCGKIDS